MRLFAKLEGIGHFLLKWLIDANFVGDGLRDALDPRTDKAG